MTTKGPIPEALRNLSLRDTRDLMTGVVDIRAERDTLRARVAELEAEAAALRAEVEAMRDLVIALTKEWWFYDGGFKQCSFCTGSVGPGKHINTIEHAANCTIPKALDALRTRKGGG